jgi:hypothetical protein
LYTAKSMVTTQDPFSSLGSGRIFFLPVENGVWSKGFRFGIGL